MNASNRRVILAVPVDPVDHRAGPDHAPVVVVEYGDFECAACRSAEPALRAIRARHQATVAFVFRQFPREDAHPHALLAAEAAEAASAQSAFWPMHDLLLAHARHLERRHLEDYARQLRLDMARFRADLDDEVYRQRVREHQAGGRKSHLRATPAFFVNGVLHEGTIDTLGSAVDSEVARLAPPP